MLEGLEREGLGHVPVVVGGIVPPEDAERLRAAGIAAVFTPKDFELSGIMRAMADIVAERWAEAA